MNDGEYYRGPLGIWRNREAEREYSERMVAIANERRDRKNKSRIARGLRKKSMAEFARGERRYLKYCTEDPGCSFGEWLKRLKGESE